jgi:hypothetical protein
MKKSHRSGIFLSFALVFALALAIISGCDLGMYEDDHGQESGSTGLRSLAVSGYELDGGFSPDKEHFEVFVDRASVSIVAEAADSGADVRFSVSDPRSVSLKEGKNTLSVHVGSSSADSRDGDNVRTYTIDIWRCNATADTVSSVGGSLLDVPVRYRVYEGEELQYTVETGSARAQPLYFKAETPYRVVADAQGKGSSAIENFIRTKYSTSLSFVSLNHELPSFAAEAPRILSLAWTSDAESRSDVDRSDIEWFEFEEGDRLDMSAIRFVKAEVITSAEVDATYYSGGGIMMEFDSAPSILGGMVPSESRRMSMDEQGRFHTQAVFDLRDFDIVDAEHVLVLSAIDRAGNRVRRDVRFSSKSGTAVPGAPLAETCRIEYLSASASTWGTSPELQSVAPGMRALKPGEQGPVTAAVAVYFDIVRKDTGMPEPILGFHVYRSDDAGASFRHIGSNNYGEPDTRFNVFWDSDIALKTDTGYIYKVTAFTEAGAANELSAVTAPVTLMPSFSLDLTSPADGAHISSGGTPTLKFRISTPGLWNPVASDSFTFSPVIKDKQGSYRFRSVLRYDLVNRRLFFISPYSEFLTTGYAKDEDWLLIASGDDVRSFLEFDASRGIVTHKPRLLAAEYNLMQTGDFIAEAPVTFEWNIMGLDINTAPMFTKARMADSGIPDRPFVSYSSSYSDSYTKGADSTNGWFDLVAE